MKNRKGALEISFGWLFAIIAGIVIIFLAIYLSSKLIGTQQTQIGAETGAQIGILTDPLETSFESAQTTSITIPTDTRIDNVCDSFGNFGNQIIQLEQKSFSKWVKTNVDVSFENKYIFSDGQTEGKKFYLFSKPLDFPFKIADLIYLTSANDVYCFSGAPDEVNTELSELNQSNLILENCSEGNIKICFGAGKCDINVDFSSNAVRKNGTVMYFPSDSRELMYAAIFSDNRTYECQVKRLMQRTKELSGIYINKEILVSKKGCENDLGGDLGQLSELAGNLKSSRDLGIVKIESDGISQKNNGRTCPLW